MHLALGYSEFVAVELYVCLMWARKYKINTLIHDWPKIALEFGGIFKSKPNAMDCLSRTCTCRNCAAESENNFLSFKVFLSMHKLCPLALSRLFCSLVCSFQSTSIISLA